MYCNSCGNETPDQATFCLYCGTRLNKECPRCAEIIRFKAKVCRFCGYEFSPEEMAKIEQLEQERLARLEERKEKREKTETERKPQKEYERWHPPERVSAWGDTVLECPKCSTLNSLNLENCRRCSASLRGAPRVKNPFV